MVKQKKETLAVAWCDNGMVDGKFMEGVVDTIINSGVEFCGSLRAHGNQIAQQREMLVNRWYDNNKSDWLLWLDSDIMITPEKFLRLWNRRDAKDIPLLTGVYFTSNEPEHPLMKPLATVYEFAEAEFGIGIRRLDPLPKNAFIKVSAAGMGFCLMHRSVITRIKEALPGVPFFTEVGANKQFTGEDIYFFAVVNKAEIPLWCDTAATVGHMKRFNMDENYYDAFGRGKGYAN
jgi:glycosyltransferase involved in cell wall biosynthesis